MGDMAFRAHCRSNDASQLIDCIWHVSANIENLVGCFGVLDARSNEWGNVVDVSEGPLLQTISVNRHWLTLEELIHEYANHVAVTIANVLPLTVNVVRAKYHIVQTKHLVTDSKFLLNRQ